MKYVYILGLTVRPTSLPVIKFLILVNTPPSDLGFRDPVNITTFRLLDSGIPKPIVL